MNILVLFKNHAKYKNTKPYSCNWKAI